MAVDRKDTTNATRMATALRDRAVRDSTGLHWRTGSFSRWMEDPFETTAVVLDALVAFDHNDPLLPDIISYFVANKRGDRWNSTKDTAMILYAMTDYLRARRIGTGKAAALDFTINEGTPRHLAFTNGLVRDVTIDGKQLSRTTKLEFANASPGIMVRAVLRYRTTGRNLVSTSHGLSVQRDFFLLGPKGQRAKQLQSGDRVPRGSYVESVVKVSHDRREIMRYLLIEDPKPAGAEALPVDDRRFHRMPSTPWVLREDRETHLAFHHEQTPPTATVRTILHLESAGDLAIAPAVGELMYQTQTRGHSGSFALRVD
jgi:uncharacterized protein YfaS (alpha-2-macroglobulin family)